MAAEMVLWENLQRTLAGLGQPTKDQMAGKLSGFSLNVRLAELAHSLEKVRGVLIALEAGDYAARTRLGNLPALLHQADDLLDVLLTDSSKKNHMAQGHGEVCLSPNVKWFLNAWRVGRLSQKIAELGEKLVKVVPSIDKCRQSSQLTPFLRGNVDHHQSFITPDHNEAAVIGRNDDVQKIIDMLLNTDEKEENVSFIPLVGSQGLGKTTLAKMVYNNDRIKSRFELRMWVRISKMSNEVEVVEQIVESCSSRKPGCNWTNDHDSGISKQHQLLRAANRSNSTADTDNIVEVLKHRLRKEIEGKLYLLILDDACIKIWSHLKDLLGVGAKGSRVLVITRSIEVADLVGTTEAYELQGLSEENSLLLLESVARVSFKDDDDDDELKEIAESILQLCGGVPLTIRVVGGLLYGKTKEMWLLYKDNITLVNSECEHVDIMDHILWLSYDSLPMRLKACVGYCSLFPEDHDFNKHDLISLWMAQGFIEGINSEVGQSLEEEGERYFTELSRRCFFQDLVKNDSGSIVRSKMHHIVHDLACQTAVGVVSTYISDSAVEHVLDPRYKHVSFSCAACPGDVCLEIPVSLFQVRTLRSLLWLKEPDCDAKIDQSTCIKLVSKFQCLRVLDLHDLGIDRLPNSIGNLTHLRYLDLSKNDGLVTLPQTITNLQKLQTLKLNSCPKLRHWPRKFGRLVNLRRLEIDECDSLACMPHGLEKLTRLETLSRFIVCRDCSDKNTCARIKSLRELQNLRGRLTVEFSTGWTSNTEEVAKANLASKSRLRELRIIWSLAKQTKQPDKNVSCYSNQSLLEALQPPPNLETLLIEGYRGEDFPSWAKMDTLASSLPNLVTISIEGCNTCQHLPPFGLLPSLKRLTLRHMANVRYVEQNEYKSSPISTEGSAYESLPASASFFKALEELTLHSFYKLEGWWKEVVVDSPTNAFPAFPCLSKLRIWNCPKLICMPLFAGVKELDLWNVNQKLLEECA